jgi:hypothetical protein
MTPQDKAAAIIASMQDIPVHARVDRLIREIAARRHCSTRLIEIEYTQDEQDHIEEFIETLALRIART